MRPTQRTVMTYSHTWTTARTSPSGTAEHGLRGYHRPSGKAPLRLVLPGPTWAFLLALVGAVPVFAQTTQGVVAGSVVDLVTGRPIEHAEVVSHAHASALAIAVRTDGAGQYATSQLSPGLYRVRVNAPGYQPQEVRSVDLPVAGRVDMDFRLRPLADVWESGAYRSVVLPGSKTLVTFYGPDVDTSRSGTFDAARGVQGRLESTVSEVVSGPRIALLPLSNRDAYTMLITQPGVTTDTTTARSLGLSTNGQRASASNFLLDGVENNNALVSGPLTPIAPEAIEEYRVSTNNYSAEYGKASGYIANAITRSGSNDWHGIGYLNLKNEALNANDFQLNARGAPRSPVKETQTGAWIGGPLRRDAILLSLALEHTRNRGRSPAVNVRLPSQRLVNFTAANSIARQLLTAYPGPYSSSNNPSDFVTVVPTVSFTRNSGLARVDRIFSAGKHRLFARVIAIRLDRPDFAWSPYPDFTSGLGQESTSAAATLASSLAPGWSHEFRLGYSRDRVSLERAHPEVPELASIDGTMLPGSSVFSTFDNRNRNVELVDNLSWVSGRHMVTIGGGVLLRGISGSLTAAPHGNYAFNTAQDFAIDRVAFFRTGLDRAALPTLAVPDYWREYRSNQFYLFAQDTWRLTPRLTLNLGIRYDAFGSPVNTGRTKDAVVELGSGNGIAERVASARVVIPSAGNMNVYDADRNDFAARVGFSQRLIGADKLLVRAAYGVFYDRLYDNLWQNVRNNNMVVPTAFPVPPAFQYLRSPTDALTVFQGRPVDVVLPTSTFRDQTVRIKEQTTRVPLTLFQPGFRTPYVHSYFLGVTSRLSPSWTLEVDALGSSGRKLVTTDLINRDLNPGIGLISYRANQGSSSYSALTTVVRHRSRRGQFQAAYTWSHTIDNQSEVLRSDYFNLTPGRLTVPETRVDVSAFSRQFDSSADRGNSDFDQRHNLVFFSQFDLPAARGPRLLTGITRDWAISQLAAFRSGFPYTVFAYGGPADPILNNRADLVDQHAAEATGALPVPFGGVRLLSPAGFARPPAGALGNTGRNSFRGPGFYNIDASISRSFALPWMNEGSRLTVRADAFNILNHANLGVPESQLGHPNFGIATYGRRPPATLRAPLIAVPVDNARQIQLLVRVSF